MRSLHPEPDDCGCQLALWPDHTLIPFVDATCRSLLDAAVTGLVLARGGDVHDPAAIVSTLVSFIAEADDRLSDVVSRARDHHMSWALIAERLGVTVPAARHRYAAHARWRRLTRHH